MVSRSIASALAITAFFAWAGCISSPTLTTANDVFASGDGGNLTSDDGGTAGETAPASDGSPDDPAHAACVAACPAGGTCEGGTCVLSCPGISTCKSGVKCPAGIPCRVSCVGARSCGPVDCGTASTCRVDCNGDSACGRITSAAPATEIVCTGKTACKEAGCNGDTCTVQCDGDACKAQEVKCCATTSCTVNGAAGSCR